jgi:formate transporter
VEHSIWNRQTLAGIPLCLVLVLVIVGGFELFTGNTLMMMALSAGKLRLTEMLRALLYILAISLAQPGPQHFSLSGQYLQGQGAVFGVSPDLAFGKATLQFDLAFLLGILCNMLVCLAV